MSDKLLPHDMDAEEATIGSVLIDETALQKIINQLKFSDFYSERNAFIYQSCVDLYNRRERINQITVAQDLSRQDKLESCGGPAFLSHLISVTPNSYDVEDYGNIVYRLSLSRKLIKMSEQIADIGYKSFPDPNETLKQFSDLASQFTQQNTLIDNSIVTPMAAGHILMDMRDDFKQKKGNLRYGYLDLDRNTTGIYNELIIVGARPSVGKSQFMLDVAENQYPHKVLFVTSEMSIKQVLERKIARELGISIPELRERGIPEEYENRFMDTIGHVSEGHISYRTGKIYARDIYNIVKKLKERNEIEILFVDYLQFLADCWEDTRENQNIRVGRACKVLKNIVTELDIPVIVASQLNRSIEYRSQETKSPVLADLRDSGNIEQDADVVLLLHRNEIDDYNLDSTLYVKQAKHRQLGIAPTIQLSWDTKNHRYCNHSGRTEVK